MTKPRVLSGVQPTGNLHLGNYLGAIANWVPLQDTHECLFMLADLHAITVPQNPADLTRNTRETAAAYIACGIDPEKSVIFPQSAVSAHAELAWILSCHTPLGWLNRMTQFKDKAKFANSEKLAVELLEYQENLNLMLEKGFAPFKNRHPIIGILKLPTLFKLMIDALHGVTTSGKMFSNYYKVS